MDEVSINVRPLTLDDYEDLREAMVLAYTGVLEPAWTKREYQRLLKAFPEGQIAVTVNEKVVGGALAIAIDYKRFGDRHTYDQITNNNKFDTHDEEGDVLYGLDIFVHPEYRGLRLGRRLYDARKELCESLNLRAIVAGGRIPHYKDYADELTPRQYIERVRLKEIYDPILTFQYSNGFHVKKILRNYLPEDQSSKTYATLLQWDNIYYEENALLFASPKTEVRIGVVQWGMRPAATLQSLLNQAEYFIDTVSDYESDFVMFPEFFNAPLMKEFNELNQAEAMRELAQYTEPIADKMREFAVSYNVNIIAGSMPFLDPDDNHLYNVSYFCRRDGSWDMIRKVHITPNERDSYGMVGGHEVVALDSDCGKIGILICYDSEFPELPRLLREQGMQLLFVPYMTDLQTGYHRVRYCAHARAIENEIYVAIAGSVGNLPRVDNMDIQYSQSAVFSPCDFSFPTSGIVAEATPNTEMVLIADVNMDLLKELHQKGSVTNIKDRRTDLYTLRMRASRNK
ncbi:MAG: amidohydrolase [Puniceicoccaceae bacterium 5H]|nr:MAG: amidohydrolase [Puniceicoccaceae bacterium 5H]